MKTFALNQIQAAEDWRPQIERFILSDGIYIVETMPDYNQIDSRIQTIINLRSQAG